MSIEQAFLDRWSSFGSLCRQVPPERVFTGLADHIATFPYVTLCREGKTKVQRTSSGTLIETTELRVNVWDDDLDRAKKSAREIQRRMHRTSFSWSHGEVLDVAKIGQAESPDGDAWHLELVFRVRFTQTQEI